MCSSIIAGEKNLIIVVRSYNAAIREVYEKSKAQLQNIGNI